MIDRAFAERFAVAAATLLRLGVGAADEQDVAAPEPDQVERRPAPAEQVIRTDRTVFLARNVGAPHHESRAGVGELIELVVQHRLTEEDDTVGAAGGRRGDEVVEIGRCDVADGEIAAAIAGCLADAGEQFEEEGV